MKQQLTLTDAAVADILEQANWYQGQSDQRLAKRWESAVTSILLRILGNPRSGSPCSFKSEELHNVRRMSVAGFPKHLIFYQLQGREILILRIVHGARDLESLLTIR